MTGWIDKQGDVWTEGGDGLMHTPETAPFSREHVEKKWGPLRPAQIVKTDERAEATGADMESLAELLLRHGHVEWDRLDAEVMAAVIITSDWLAAHTRAAVEQERAAVGARFAEWAAKNEIAEPPLDWAWFGEIVRWTGTTAHVENAGGA